MNRRRLLQAGAALPLLPDSWPRWPRPAPAAAAGPPLPASGPATLDGRPQPTGTDSTATSVDG